MAPTLKRTIHASLLIMLGSTPLVHAAPITGQGTWETTLLARDLDGNANTVEAYYDTVLDITWLADANGSNNTDPGFYYGLTTWDSAMAWAANLNVGGITGWRLPVTNPIDGTTADDASFSYTGSEDLGYSVSAPGTAFAGSTASEMAHLYYNTLGNVAICDPTTSTTTCENNPEFSQPNTGLFSNFGQGDYWSATTYAIGLPDNAWRFDMFYGNQSVSTKSGPNNRAWAVHDGDIGVAVVPLPGAAWLFASGAAGLLGLVRRNKHS